MDKCCAICGNSSLGNELRMFVAKDYEQKRWNKACKKEIGKSNVCEIHFKKDCFKEFNNGTIRLKPGSVPTLFLPSEKIKILQDAPPSTGFKNLQSKVQTVCLPPADSGTTIASPNARNTLPCVIKPVQYAVVSLPSLTNQTTQYVPLKTPSVTNSMASLTKQTTYRKILPLKTPSPTKAPSAPIATPSYAFLPPSLTITPTFKNPKPLDPLPPLEFVSVNTPIKPLRSESASTLMSQRLQIRTLLNANCLEKRMEADSQTEKKPIPVKIEIEKFNIPCKITKIDPPQISTTFIHNNGNKTDFGTQTNDEIIFGATCLENIKLKRENTQLKAEISRLQKKIEFDLCQNRKVSKLFTQNQMRKLRTPNSHITWNWEDICWAITLQAAGPRAYKHLYHKGFPIPNIQTLQRWIRNIKCECGILTQVIDILKNIAELQMEDRVCVLCFDEMELSPNDNNNVDSNVTQRQFAQVAIVRGLKSPWKQPIFYDFNCIMSKSVIMNIVSHLYTAGFVVVALVVKLDNDQILMDELEVSKDKTWFEHPCDKDAKIFTFIDAPQLLNLIRNQFIDGGFIFKEQFISSYNIQQILLNHLTGAKLSNVHLEIKNFGREKIKMATQLFSKTTVNAILKYKSNDDNDAIECANFIKLIENWYGILSSTPCSVLAKKAFGLSLENQKKVLENMNEVMEENINLSSFQDGILITNKSLCDLYDYVKEKYKIDYILTFRLNQDILATFFDNIKGDDPDLQLLSEIEFQQNFRKYLFSGNVRHFRKNFKDIANESNGMNNSSENYNDISDGVTNLISNNIMSEERCAKDDRPLSSCIIPSSIGHNNTLEDCLMDAGIESIHEDEEKYMEDYVMNELILEDL